jgi:hypothetical protein
LGRVAGKDEEDRKHRDGDQKKKQSQRDQFLGQIAEHREKLG